MEHISTEKKMELIRTIREENARNKSRIRQREHILFGKEVPLVDFERRENEMGIAEEMPSATGLKIRLFLAAILFLGFVIMDMGKISLQGVDSARIQEEISKDVTINMQNFVEEFSYAMDK